MRGFSNEEGDLLVFVVHADGGHSVFRYPHDPLAKVLLKTVRGSNCIDQGGRDHIPNPVFLPAAPVIPERVNPSLFPANYSLFLTI